MTQFAVWRNKHSFDIQYCTIFTIMIGAFYMTIGIIQENFSSDSWDVLKKNCQLFLCIEFATTTA